MSTICRNQETFPLQILEEFHVDWTIKTPLVAGIQMTESSSSIPGSKNAGVLPTIRRMALFLNLGCLQDPWLAIELGFNGYWATRSRVILSSWIVNRGPTGSYPNHKIGSVFCFCNSYVGNEHSGTSCSIGYLNSFLSTGECKVPEFSDRGDSPDTSMFSEFLSSYKDKDVCVLVEFSFFVNWILIYLVLQFSFFFTNLNYPPTFTEASLYSQPCKG